MSAAKLITARRPPARARAPTATASLGFDDEVDEGALPVADPELEEEPEPEPVVLDEEIEPMGSSLCRHDRHDCSVGGERRGMLVNELYAQSRVECDSARHLAWASPLERGQERERNEDREREP
jgi:hypothetical protein